MLKIVTLNLGVIVENENELMDEIVNKVNEGNFEVTKVEDITEIENVTENDLIYKSLEIKGEIEMLNEFDGSELIEKMEKLLELYNEYNVLSRNIK